MIGDMPSFPGFNAPLLTVVVHLPLLHCVCTGFLQVPAAAKGPDLHSFKGKQIPAQSLASPLEQAPFPK
jgi:hypothetical protein